MSVRCFTSVLLLLVACGSSHGAQMNPPQSVPAAPAKPTCETPQHSQFDFWIGRWEVWMPNGKAAGHNRIEKAYNGCALVENWTSANGGTGISTNYFDPEKRAWVQNWVDGTGGVIQLEGGLVGNAMILDGRYVQLDGTASRLRGTWTPLDSGYVRQLFEESKDGGASWTVWFDGEYRPVQ